MSELKVTPGEWHPFFGGDGMTVAIMTKDRREVVHWMGFDSSHYPKHVRANAHLLAASKRLYLALENLLKAKKCPDCDDDGFAIQLDDWGAPEQAQCQFCYTTEDSLFMRRCDALDALAAARGEKEVEDE